MGQVSLSGALIVGPPSAGDGFPASLYNTPLSTLQSPKQAAVATGVVTRQLNSPNSFTALQGVGSTDTVTHGDTIYFKCNGQVSIRLTFDDGNGGSTTAVIPVMGLYFAEIQTGKYLKLLEAQGSASIEYMISGQS